MREVLVVLGASTLAVLALHLLALAVCAYLRRRWLREERADRLREREMWEERLEAAEHWADEQLRRWIWKYNAFFLSTSAATLRVFAECGPAEIAEWRQYARALAARGDHPLDFVLALAMGLSEDPERVRASCPYQLEEDRTEASL